MDIEPRQYNLGTVTDTARETVGDRIFNRLLQAIHDGAIRPGERINDLLLAKELGVSRTPVREALQRLRNVGVIEAEPNRFTRVRRVSDKDVRDYLVVWVSLMRAIIQDVTDLLTKQAIRSMQTAKAKFVAAARVGNSRAAADAVMEYFSIMVSFDLNPALVANVEAAQHVLRIGGVQLPRWVDIEVIEATLGSIISAAEEHDEQAAVRALDNLRSLHIPLATAAPPAPSPMSADSHARESEGVRGPAARIGDRLTGPT